MICDGRDASDDSDSCGREAAVKACRLALLDRADHKPEDIVFHFGPPVLGTKGVTDLGNNRVAVAVGRGRGKWDIDIWEVPTT